MVTMAASVSIPATQMQNFLIGKGFDIGTATADGIFGPSSVMALGQALTVVGKMPSAATVTADKRTVNLETSAWAALAMLPTKPPVRRSGSASPLPGYTVIPGGPVVPVSDGPGWGNVMPWLIGGAVVIGGYFLWRGQR